jgi:tetratricopeptide (TPR) repeat protein
MRDARRRALGFALPLLLIVLLGACRRAPPLDAVAAFEQANRALLEAKSPDDALRAAAGFESALALGGENGAVLHGLGNAWMKAGKRGRAIAAWRRALQYRPRDPFLQANLEQALGHRLSGEERPLLRTLLFWHDALSFPEKADLLVGCTALACALFLLARAVPRTRPFARPACGGATVLALLAATSYALAVRERDFTQHGVVAAGEAVARKGNAESFEPAFNEPMKDGAEFVVLERRGDWLRVRVRDGLEGWLPADRTETW